MNVVFISNYLNHHQIPFSDEMYKLLNGSYYFIQTEVFDEERINMGWKIENDRPYFLESYKETNKCQKLIDTADIVIIGSADDTFIENRRRNNKVIFRYSERIYKRGTWRVVSPRGFYYMNKVHYQRKDGRMYMLCASAYTAGDLSMLGFYKNKTYKWGYFPEFRRYNINDLMGKKRHGICEIIWCARFLKWKHPELCLNAATALRKAGLDFHITMIGTGELRGKYEALAKKAKLDSLISFEGPFSPAEVRNYMERSNIFLFTSDYEEGWGAVLNEAMNSGCAVIASHAAGATPFLVRNNVNGMIYKNGEKGEFIDLLLHLVQDKGLQEKLGRRAYRTIESNWNPRIAAEKFCDLSKAILKNNEYICKSGPCSKAIPVRQGKMWRAIKKIKKKG